MEETTFYSFIVRIWQEKPEAGEDQGAWRGYITHVPSGRQRYFEDLNQIPSFIAPYLERISMNSDGGK